MYKKFSQLFAVTTVLTIAVFSLSHNLAISSVAQAAPSRGLTKTETITGELEVVVEDERSDWRTLYYLNVGKEKLSLHFTKDLNQDLTSGSRVSVRGVRSGNRITVEDLVDQKLDNAAAAAGDQLLSTVPNTTGEHKVLVILVNFQDLQTQPYTAADARDVTFNTTSNFYRENSYGQTWLTGDVYGWYTIPVSSTNCDTTAIANYAQQAAANAGANLSAYSHYVYAFPANSCTFTGRGSIGGSPSQAWINGWYELGTVGHELGHNFGLNHSRAMDCGSVVIGGTCTINEYGDSFDLMGASSTGHFNSYQKERLGWLNSVGSPPIQTVTTSGTYFVDAYEPGGTNYKALKVLKSYDPATGTRTWYYIELRTTTGFDATVSPNPAWLNGMVVHTGSDTNPQDIYLLDMTPATASWDDATLMTGQSFTDSAAGVTFTTVSAGSTGAWVQISIGAAACTRANPTVSVSPAQTGWLSSGTAYTYTLTVKNNDSTGCAASNFSTNATVPNGWSGGSGTLNLSPGATASAAVVVTSPANTSDGNYGVQLRASNVSDPSSVASSAATYSIVSRLNVTDASNSARYSRTQKATITATVSAAGSAVPNASVRFTLTKPGGLVVTQNAVTGTNGVATFVYTFNKRTDPIGTYQVSSVSTVNGLSGTGSTSFSVTK